MLGMNNNGKGIKLLLINWSNLILDNLKINNMTRLM